MAGDYSNLKVRITENSDCMHQEKLVTLQQQSKMARKVACYVENNGSYGAFAFFLNTCTICI